MKGIIISNKKGRHLLPLLGLLLMVGCASSRGHGNLKGHSERNNKLVSTPVGASHYTVQNAHSHNDYIQWHYFTAAYGAGFGSIEADIYLVNDNLLVSHNKKDVTPLRTLAGMYLEPLAAHVEQNKGYPYKNHKAQLELLIDLKDPKDSPEYAKAVALILSYKAFAKAKNLRFTFTGNIPSDHIIAKASAPIYFDGVPGRRYSPAAIKRIFMLSDNFARYSAWNGQGDITESDYQLLLTTVKAAHKQGKMIRFWNAPDNPATWQLMEKLGVDYINTDKIQALATFLRK